MDALKRMLLALAATTMVAGLAPAHAQDTRDTRPEPERPRTERGDGGGSNRIGEPFVPEALRKFHLGFHETLGVTCVTFWWHGADSKTIGFTNGGDEVIPKGTVFTFIIQPGGQTGTWTLNYDLPPGESWYAEKLTGVDAEQLECDVVVKDKVVAEKPAGDKVP
jgi:hypothetical protein